MVWARKEGTPDVEILEGPFRIERYVCAGGWTPWNLDNPYVYLVQPPDGTAQLIGETALKEKPAMAQYTFARYRTVNAESKEQACEILRLRHSDRPDSDWVLVDEVEVEEEEFRCR